MVGAVGIEPTTFEHLIKPTVTPAGLVWIRCAARPGITFPDAKQLLQRSKMVENCLPAGRCRLFVSKCQGFKPDLRNSAVRHYRGGLVKRSHGGIVNPPCNRKGKHGNPSPTGWRARGLSQQARFAPWSYPTATVAGSDPRAAPRLIVPMSLQPVIPRRVAPQQSSPPLYQPKAILKEKRKNEKGKPLNRMCANSKLSQQRGSP